MTSQVTIQKHQDHVAVKVRFKNPITGDVTTEQIIEHNSPVPLVIFDTQSLEIEEIRSEHSTPVKLTFGQAVEQLKRGKKVARNGWNGKGMFLFLVPGSTFNVNRPPLLGIYPEGTEINYCPHIDMKTADEKVVPWLASQTDVLSEDWQVIE